MMSKKPRPSMADALAEIAATPPRGNVTTSSRADVGSAEARGNVTTSSSSTTPEGFKVRQRVEKPHVSLYAHPKVFLAIRDIAASEGRKPHDIYTDGLRLVLKNYGRDFDKLNRGE